MAKVLHIFRAPKKRLPMEELDAVRVLKNSGLEGCAHARPGGKRQVLLVDRETLEAMDLRPGMIRENITTDGINVNSLELGQELRVGETRLQVTRFAPLAISWRNSGPGCEEKYGDVVACCAGYWKAARSGAAMRSKKLCPLKRNWRCHRLQNLARKKAEHQYAISRGVILQGVGLRRSDGAPGGRVLSSVFSTGSSGGTIQSKPRCSSMVPRKNFASGAINRNAARRKSAASAGVAF